MILYNGKLFSDIKKEILSRPTTWTNLEDIMLSEIIQSQNRTSQYDFTYTKCLE